MDDLHEKNCIPCRGGIPPFDISEIHKYLKKVDGWNVKKKENEIYFLERNFTFKNFSESQKFINHVGDIAEKEDHHPDLVFEMSGASKKHNYTSIICCFNNFFIIY